MNPLYDHDCACCEFIGTVFGVYDIYVHGDDKEPTCIARYGSEGSEYASRDINLKEEVKMLQNTIGGITRSHAIVLIMFKSMPSLVMNHMKTAEDYNTKKKIIERTFHEFRVIEVNPDIVDRIVNDYSDNISKNYLEDHVNNLIVSSDIIKSYIERYDIERIPYTDCSLCHKMTHFEVIRCASEDIKIYFNGNCDCIENTRKWLSSLDAVCDHIANQTNWKVKMASMICCGLVPFSIDKNIIL